MGVSAAVAGFRGGFNRGTVVGETDEYLVARARVPGTMLRSRRSTIDTPAACSRSACTCSEAARRPRTRFS